MRTLIYVKVSHQESAKKLLSELRTGKDTASIRVIEFWYGEIERCDIVVTDDARVANAYSEAGVKVMAYTKKQPETIVETPAQEVVVYPEPVRRGRKPNKDSEQ